MAVGVGATAVREFVSHEVRARSFLRRAQQLIRRRISSWTFHTDSECLDGCQRPIASAGDGGRLSTAPLPSESQRSGVLHAEHMMGSAPVASGAGRRRRGSVPAQEALPCWDAELVTAMIGPRTQEDVGHHLVEAERV